MGILTTEKLPKYIYTMDLPYINRAFLTITVNVQGYWSAGYCVWYENGQAFDYGPKVEGCTDLDQAIIQLYQAYKKWEEEQDGLRRSRSTG